MNTPKGLGDFCRTHKIIIPKGDDFNLLDFLLEVSQKSIKLAEYKGSVTEIIRRLGEDSEEWGGCPRCGSNVHLGLKECPVCGLDLSAEEDDVVEASEADDDLSDLDPSYIEEDEVEEVDDLDELDDEEDEFEEEPDEEVDEEEEDPLDEAFEEEGDEGSEEVEEEDADDLDEFEDEEEPEEEEEDLEEEELEDEDEFEEEEDEPVEEEPEELEEEEEPLSTAKASVQQKKVLKKKREKEDRVDPRRNLMSHSEKVRAREERRRKLESLLHKFKRKPDLVDRLKYRDLLIMPGLLGYTKKPTTLGGKKDIQSWVKKSLKKRS